MSPLGKAQLAFPDRAAWSWNSHHKVSQLVVEQSHSQSAARPPESVQPRARVRRPEVWRCTRRSTCPGVADERVGNIAVAEANSKRAIRMLFYLKRSCALTRSLPRDVYIRRQNDHPGGQGRIYTSHLNFVSTHLSKPGHRRGCCCMSPRCLLRQFVDRCLLFWAFFIEKTVLLCFARFLSKWRETALWMFPDATSWYEGTFDGLRRSRRELVSSCWKRGLRMTVDICWEKKLVTGAPGGKMTTLLLWTKTSTFQLTVNARLAIAFVEGSSVRMYEHRCEWNIASQLSGEVPSRSAVSERW